MLANDLRLVAARSRRETMAFWAPSDDPQPASGQGLLPDLRHGDLGQ